MSPKEYGAWVIFTGQLSTGTYNDEDMLPYHDGGLGALLIYS